MDVVEYRSEVSTIRSEVSSEISTASSGFAFVTIPLQKQRAAIPPYEPPPDYSPLVGRRQNRPDGYDVKQSLLHQESSQSTPSTSEVYNYEDDTNRKPKLRIQTDTQNHVTVEVFDAHSPTTTCNTSLSPTSNTEFLLQPHKASPPETGSCTCSKKCLCMLVAILCTALLMTLIFVTLFFTVCIGGRTPACS